tara:strand:- start:228 stop:626 length:399 start_codon:yes stop_codon:yes gene_type:complete
MIEEYKELIWFFAGIFAYRTLSTLLVYGHMSVFVQNITDQALKMMGTVSEDIGFIRETKYKNMTDTGHSEEQIKTIREIDDRVFSMWKSTCISHMLVNYPQPYRRQLKFEDWEGAMQELDRLYKYESKKKKS